MKKQDIIDVLNQTDDFKSMGFESVADDGSNSLLRRPCGRGFIFLNRFENEDIVIYSDDIDGWNSGR